MSIVAIPDAMLSTLSGIYDALNSFELLGDLKKDDGSRQPFSVEIVGLDQTPTETASGLALAAQRAVEDVNQTDIIIVPSVMVRDGTWKTGRYPSVVSWLRRMHGQGAALCSACSGVLLLGETGLLDGHEATIHWAYARTFSDNFPAVRLRVDKVLVISGERQEFIMSGASASWHDLVLHLVARHVGHTAAQSIAKFMLLQWHADGQAPYIVFSPVMDHGDAIVLTAQQWLAEHFVVERPVEQLVNQSGLPPRTFKRRFKRATGFSPISYVQQVRIEEAKRRLERTESPVEQVSWDVGYEDPAFFRRLFKRVTGITPGRYRRKFKIPPLRNG